ncbi:MAG: hypothetical protein HYU47_03250 [Deltaproteobacteria bacterium]|nr:hypothetical protein [Deltaproteobacteria bacterium]
MKITKVRAVAHEVKNIITGWKISLGTKDNHELIFVRIDTDAKIFGVGVASPGAIYISGDTGAHHLELINRVLGPARCTISWGRLWACRRTGFSAAPCARRCA